MNLDSFGFQGGNIVGTATGVQSVTGLNTDNTDPENPIINISVDGTTITGSGTPIDPLVSVGAISGSGALNFVSKWTGIDSLGNSQIRDNGTTLAIGIAPQANISLKVLSIQEYGFASENTKTTSNTYGIAGSATGIGKARGVGVYGESSGGTLSNIGTEGAGVGGTVAIGGKFTSSTATTNYSVQLQDGTEGVGKVLTSMTADGKAQWVTQTVGANVTLSNLGTTAINAGLVPASTNSIALGSPTKNWENLYVRNVLLYDDDGSNRVSLSSAVVTTNYEITVPNVIGTVGQVLQITSLPTATQAETTWTTPTSAPSWLESNATDLTIWNNGQGNIATNTSFGDGALKSNTIGSNNTAVGFEALRNNTSVSDLTAIGFNALYSNTSGTGNTAIGTNALKNNTLGADNIAIGKNALYTNNANGDRNIAIGTVALYNNVGFYNVGIGFQALFTNTGGENNTAVGDSALLFNTTAFRNAAVGFEALRNNTTGESNTALGTTSLRSNTTGGFNTAVGRSALIANTTGTDNVGVGYAVSSGNFSGSVILGKSATATASNQFVVGSVATNAGTVTAEVNVSANVWNVVINGVARKILLA